MAAPACDVRVRVAALIVREGGVVVVRHAKDGRTYHLLPGGGVEPGETLREALVREIAQETGLRCTVGPLLFVNDSIDPDGSRHVVQMTFEARGEGALTHAPEDPRVAAVDVVAPEALAALDLRPPFADSIAAYVRTGRIETAYLGPLWAGEHKARGTEGVSVTD